MFSRASTKRTIDEERGTCDDERRAGSEARGGRKVRGGRESRRAVRVTSIARVVADAARKRGPSLSRGPEGFFANAGPRRDTAISGFRAHPRGGEVRGDSWKRRASSRKRRASGRSVSSSDERPNVATRSEPRTKSTSRSTRLITHTHLVLLLVLLGLGVLHLLESTLENLHALVDLLHRPVDLQLELATVRHLDRGFAPSVAVPAPGAFAVADPNARVSREPRRARYVDASSVCFIC